MSLVERLGYRSLNELYATMDNNEIMEWLAYDMLRNPEMREKIEKEQLQDLHSSDTAEQQADSIRAILLSLGQ